MERINHRKLTARVIDTIYPDIDRVLRNTLIRASLFTGLKDLFIHRRDLNFERIAYAPHESTWEIGILEIRYRLMKYTWHYKRGFILRAGREAGVLIHMIVAFFCHSNVLSLSAEAREKAIQSLLSLSSYPELDDLTLMFASRNVLQFFGLQKDGVTHSQTKGWYPDSGEIQLISEVVGRFFRHYGIIVYQD